MSENATELKSLEYYLANPDEMPDDDASMTALMGGADEAGATDHPEGAASGNDTTDTTGDDEKTDTGEKDGGDVTPDPDEKDDTDDEPEVLAADGKNRLPFSVVKGLRSQVRDKDEEIATLRAKLESMTPASEAGGEKGTEGDGGAALPTDAAGAIDFDKLSKEYPEELVAAFKASTETVESLRSQLGQFESRLDERDARDQDTQRAQIQHAIDAVPALATWQSAEDNRLWRRAVALDGVLREEPEFADLGYEARFREVVKQLGYDPDSGEQVSATPQPKPEKKVERKQTVEAAEKAADAAARVPTSLSDIPGGEAGAQSGVESLEQISAAQLTDKFMDMTPEQQERWLASHGV